MNTEKSIHAKPSLYAFYFEALKFIAFQYGYNLVLHGSMKRDLDLIAIPWQHVLGNVDKMIEELASHIGGEVMRQTEEERTCFPHGRKSYVININRAGKWNNYQDAEYYIDISVTPHLGTKLHSGWSGCRSDNDGDCTWKHCPQLRDNEPDATGRHCPLDSDDEEL